MKIKRFNQLNENNNLDTTKLYTKQDLIDAFDAGYESKTGTLDYTYGEHPYIEYEQIETFDHWFDKKYKK